MACKKLILTSENVFSIAVNFWQILLYLLVMLKKMLINFYETYYCCSCKINQI